MQLRVVPAPSQSGSARTLRRPAHSLLTADAMWVQRTIGNQAVGQLLRQGVPALAAVQRQVQWGPLLKTKNNALYGISEPAARMLVSAQGAPDPKPVELYRQTRDTNENGAMVKTWVPNVKFIQKPEIRRNEKNDEKGERPRSPRVGPSDWQKDALEKIARYELALEKAMVPEDPGQKTLRSNVSSTGPNLTGVDEPTPPLSVRAPDLGILGLNDCGEWAQKLQRLIAEEAVHAGSLQRPLNASGAEDFDLGKRPEDMPAVGVGDTMTQQLFGSGSQHHAATVVARDTFTIVTLEAHVEKNLDAPVFHFYDGGLPGFVDANNAGPTFREANRVGVGNVKHLEALTKAFYDDLQLQLQYFLAALKENPYDFHQLDRLLTNFKEIVRKPTITIGGLTCILIEDYLK